MAFAFLAPVWASFLAYIAVNGISLAVKIVPVVAFVVLLIVEWFTASVWGKCGYVVLAVLAAITFADLKGYLPVLPVKPTPAPTPAPKPAK